MATSRTWKMKRSIRSFMIAGQTETRISPTHNLLLVLHTSPSAFLLSCSPHLPAYLTLTCLPYSIPVFTILSTTNGKKSDSRCVTDQSTNQYWACLYAQASDVYTTHELSSLSRWRMDRKNRQRHTSIVCLEERETRRAKEKKKETKLDNAPKRNAKMVTHRKKKKAPMHRQMQPARDI